MGKGKNKMEQYRSPYEAYPFLCDEGEDLRCDFELLTDEMASQTGLLAAKAAETGRKTTAAAEEQWKPERASVEERGKRKASEVAKEEAETRSRIHQELLWLCELIYHINPTLRTRLTVTEEETERLRKAVERLREECGDRCKRFVLTQGCESACIAHILRVRSKMLVRLIYRHCEQGHQVPERLLDLANLLSGYFFYLALKLNALEGVEEIDYVSRNY